MKHFGEGETTRQPLGRSGARERRPPPRSDAPERGSFNLFTLDASVLHGDPSLSCLPPPTPPLLRWDSSLIVYPTPPGRVCPHNPIIPDQIFHPLERFQPCPDCLASAGTDPLWSSGDVLALVYSPFLRWESREGRASGSRPVYRINTSSFTFSGGYSWSVLARGQLKTAC